MLRLLLSLVALLATLFMSRHSLHAQVEWAPIGATWHYTFRGGFGGEIEYLTLESIKDTIINDVNTKVLSQTIHRVDGDLDTSLGNLYIYQDENQIYYWSNLEFELLYDFDADLGDTLKIKDPIDRMFHDPERDSISYYIVDSLDVKEIGGETLNGLFLSPIDGQGSSDFQHGDWVYEKIGSQLYFIPVRITECDNECADVFRCYEDNSISYRAVDYPCDTIVERIVSTRDSETLQNSLQVYQNPIMSGNSLEFSVQASSKVTTDLGLISFEVSDVSGRRIMPITVMQDREQRLSTAGFAPGIYFLIVHGRSGVAQKRIVIY